MSTLTTDRPDGVPGAVPTGRYGLGGVLHSEWTKLTTVR